MHIESKGNFTISILSKISYCYPYFAAQDGLSNAVLLFKKGQDNWMLEQVIGSRVMDTKRYIAKDISDSVLSILKGMNFINSMFFAPQL